MKNKIITTMLFLVLVVSIVGNVYQFNVSKDIEDNIGCYTTELSGLNDNIDSLNNDITAKDNELATLSTKITELESSIQTIKTENDSLSAQVSELKTKKSELEKEEIANKEAKALGDNIVDSAVAEVFADIQAENSSTSGWSSTPEADAYVREHSNGTYDPNNTGAGTSDFGKGDYSGLEQYQIQ